MRLALTGPPLEINAYDSAIMDECIFAESATHALISIDVSDDVSRHFGTASAEGEWLEIHLSDQA